LFVESLHWFDIQEFLFINPVEAQDFVIAGRAKNTHSIWLRILADQLGLLPYTPVAGSFLKVHIPLTQRPNYQ
jgi:hypothetical protein